jgi:hypothetical protein
MCFAQCIFGAYGFTCKVLGFASGHHGFKLSIGCRSVGVCPVVWAVCGIAYGYFKISVFKKGFNPLYSYLSTAKGVNVLWVLGCKAGTEQSELTQVNPSRFYIGIATPKIGRFNFPNFEEELYRQDYS